MIVGFTGHRKLAGTDFDPKKLKSAILSLIKRGANKFLCGMAIGFDLEAAKVVLSLKQKYDLKLVACKPCENQEKNYSDEDKALYRDILSKCDEVVTVTPHYNQACMFMRDRYVVENSDVLLAFLRVNKGGTRYTVSQAQRMGKEIIFL